MDYKNKLEEAKRLYETANADQRYVLESPFPELKEGEDEKIRNEIILYVGARNDISLDTHNRWLSWLEKQGEPKSYSWKPTKEQFEALDYAYNSCSDTERGNYYEGVLETLIEDLHRLEKQGEQTSTNNQFTPEQANILDKHIDKFLGQEPADKVEPKFHEGDFVVDNCGYVWKIKGVLNRFYVLEGVEGGESRPTIEWVNKTFHLWTIKDAKEGDVLYCKNSDIEYIVMNKGVNEHGNIDSYFRYNSLNGFGVDIPSVFSSRQDDITPATKEQRDTLFAKMKEAGYKWDTEKKELRKIEQRPAYKVEPKSDFELCLKHIMEEAIECGDTHNLGADAELLYNIAQKSAEWSEEDEERYLSCLKRLSTGDIKQPETINTVWLKSLKDRVHPQPKQEWNEEDEHMLKAIFDSLNTYAKMAHPCLKSVVEEEINWLKSLKPQKQWKPSEKQIDAIHYVVQHYNPNACERLAWDSLKTLEIMYNDLKNLTE